MIRPIHLARMALMAACGGTLPAADSIRSTGAASPPAIAGDTLIRPTEVPDHFRLLDSLSVDVDGDGALERMDLAAVVGVDDEGTYSWDDRQEWLVAVRDGADTYPLLQEHLHWGSAAFWIVDGDSAGPPAIMVLTEFLHYPRRNRIRMEKFVFDRSRGGYVRTGSISGSGDFTRYRGPPPGSGISPSFRPYSDPPSDPDNPPDH